MARKRGFFAELHHQHQVAEKRRRQAATTAARANAAAARTAEQARRQATQMQAQLARLSAAERKTAEQEAQRLHDEAMFAEAEAMNAQLAQTRDEVDSILTSTLLADPFVDLEGLRRFSAHPPFPRADLEVPLQQPVLRAAQEEPRYVEPDAPKGIGGLFGAKKRHADAMAAAQAEFAKRHALWEAEVADLPAAQLRQMQDFQRAEQQRCAWVEQARREYRAECDRRDAEVTSANTALDQLIRGLETGVPEAIHEYVGVVLSNSTYPESFGVEHEFTYDATLKELSLTATVPQPNSLPAEMEFRYIKSKGEIAPTLLAQKDRKERYSEAICQVALRTLHEVFAADRSGQIQTIALTVDTEGIDAATGLPKRTKLVVVAAERLSFLTFDLANVVPLATLQHLNALVSKSPFELVGIDPSKTVRG